MPEPVPAAVEARAAVEPPAASPQTPPQTDPLEDFFFRPDEDPGVLADLPEEEPVAQDVTREALEEFLTFRLADETYAIELERVREIAKVPPVTEVPRAPAWVLGVMNLRGEVMPVFDLHRRLGLVRQAPCGRGSRIVVVETEQGTAGMLVEAVEQVVRLRPSTIEVPPPGLGAGVDTDYIVGIGRQNERMFVLLNLPSVLGLAAPRGAR